jgi:hypothetical protein
MSEKMVVGDEYSKVTERNYQDAGEDCLRRTFIISLLVVYH